MFLLNITNLQAAHFTNTIQYMTNSAKLICIYEMNCLKMDKIQLKHEAVTQDRKITTALNLCMIVLANSPIITQRDVPFRDSC